MPSAYAPESGDFYTGVKKAEDLWFNETYGEKLAELGYQDTKNKVEAATQEIDSRNKMLDLYQQGLERQESATGLPASLEDQTRLMAEAAIAAGRPIEGATIMTKLSKAQFDSAHAQDLHLKAKESAFTTMANSLDPSKVYDTQSWQKYWQNYSMLHPQDLQDPEIGSFVMDMMHSEYDPSLAAQIRDQAVSQLDKIKIEREKMARKKDESIIELNKFKEKESAAKADQARATAEARRKTGVVVGSTIRPSDVAQATAVIASKYDLTDPAVKASAAAAGREVEETARVLIADDPTLSLSQAREKAMGVVEAKGGLTRFRELRPIPGSLGNPMAPVNSVNQLQRGKWYRGPQGQVAFWDGAKFLTVQEMRDAGNLQSYEEPPPDDEEDDSEDDTDLGD